MDLLVLAVSGVSMAGDSKSSGACRGIGRGGVLKVDPMSACHVFRGVYGGSGSVGSLRRRGDSVAYDAATCYRHH